MGASNGSRLKLRNNQSNCCFVEAKRPNGAAFYIVFSRVVTATMFLSLNKGTAAMLVSPTNSLGIELYSYGNAFFCFG